MFNKALIALIAFASFFAGALPCEAQMFPGPWMGPPIVDQPQPDERPAGITTAWVLDGPPRVQINDQAAAVSGACSSIVTRPNGMTYELSISSPPATIAPNVPIAITLKGQQSGSPAQRAPMGPSYVPYGAYLRIVGLDSLSEGDLYFGQGPGPNFDPIISPHASETTTRLALPPRQPKQVYIAVVVSGGDAGIECTWWYKAKAPADTMTPAQWTQGDDGSILAKLNKEQFQYWGAAAKVPLEQNKLCIGGELNRTLLDRATGVAIYEVLCEDIVDQ